MKSFSLFILVLCCAVAFAIVWWILKNNHRSSRDPYQTPVVTTGAIRYVAIGDSYTIGEGVRPDESWPTVLTEHLKDRRVSIELIANPSRTGWTTQDAIERELPMFENAKPDFATLLIGVNDWVQGVDAKTFRERLDTLMDRMLKALGSPDKMVSITIPDFSVTPTGKHFGDPIKNSKGIQEFNTIIKEESAKRGIAVVDIFALSQEMGKDTALVTPDGLHPSAEEYKHWEAKIFPEVIKLVQHLRPQ